MDNHDLLTRLLGLPPLIMGLICATGAAAALLTYHCIVSRRCTHQRPAIPRGHPWLLSAANLEADMLSSIETSIVELIPSYEYTKDIGMVTKTQDKTCAVCLCEFMDGEPVRVLPECLHPFHVPCIDMWLYSHSNCPVCRTDTTLSRLPLGHRLEVDEYELPPPPAATRSGATR